MIEKAKHDFEKFANSVRDQLRMDPEVSWSLAWVLSSLRVTEAGSLASTRPLHRPGGHRFQDETGKEKTAEPLQEAS